MITFSCIADQHGCLDIQIQPCDFLLIAGDISPLNIQSNTKKCIGWLNGTFLPWLDSQPAKHKIFIAGNHDFMFTEIDRLYCPKDCYYLFDEGIELEGIKFWGSPWTPWFWDWAFNFPKFDLDGSVAKGHWAKIPDDTNILITHGPPSNILDKVNDRTCGCPDLNLRIQELKELKLHVSGHIHQGYGHKIINNITFVNAAYGYEGQENYKIAPSFKIDI